MGTLKSKENANNCEKKCQSKNLTLVLFISFKCPRVTYTISFKSEILNLNFHSKLKVIMTLSGTLLKDNYTRFHHKIELKVNGAMSTIYHKILFETGPRFSDVTIILIQRYFLFVGISLTPLAFLYRHTYLAICLTTLFKNLFLSICVNVYIYFWHPDMIYCTPPLNLS